MDRTEERITELEKTVSKLTRMVNDLIGSYNDHYHATTVSSQDSYGNTYDGPDTASVSKYLKVNPEDYE